MRARPLVLVGVAVGAVAACGGDSTGPSLPDIVGTWNATKLEFVSKANAATKADVVALGATVHLVIAANNTFTSTLTPPGQPPDVGNGTYVETATTLTVTTTSDTPPEILVFSMVLSGTTLTLTGASSTFDFGSGPVPVFVNLTLTKQ
ncbi:MAG TPA: hypothetical protein VGP61_04475 [Gemmatimonadales bacterium]|jgi:hypothetical protein|nr:hypothetical protein [Gemmatimonadales bacterium]